MSTLLAHPLVVLFVGALITGLLIPWLTRQWQDRQKELEVKTKLVSDMSDSSLRLIQRVVAVRILRTWLPPQKSGHDEEAQDHRIQEQYREAFDAMNREAHEFIVKSAVIGTNLQAYLPQSEIPRKWSEFSDIVSRFYAMEGIHGEEKRKRYEDELRQKLSILSNSEIVAGEDWEKIRERLLEENTKLIQNVLKSRLSVFDRPSVF